MNTLKKSIRLRGHVPELEEELIYVDDAQVVKTESAKTPIDGSFHIRGATVALLQAFSDGSPFIHVRITGLPDMSKLK